MDVPFLMERFISLIKTLAFQGKGVSIVKISFGVEMRWKREKEERRRGGGASCLKQ